MRNSWSKSYEIHDLVENLFAWSSTYDVRPPDEYHVYTSYVAFRWFMEKCVWEAIVEDDWTTVLAASDYRSGCKEDAGFLYFPLTDLAGWLHRCGGKRMALKIKKASVKSRPLKIGIMAPSGAGKTYTALTFAKAAEHIMGVQASERNYTLVLDSENDSSALYADQFDGWSYDTGESDKTWDGYESALREAIKLGYKVLIVDSATHLWLALKDDVTNVAKNNKDMQGNKMAAWGFQKSRARQFLEFLTRAPIHVIVTFRAETVMEEQEYTDNYGRTKKKRVPVGVKPEYDGDPSYEFDLFASMTRDHTMTFLKARRASEQLDSKEFEKPGFELVSMLLEGFQEGSVETTATKLTERIQSCVDEEELNRIVVPLLKAAKDDPTVNKDELVRLREAYAVKQASFPKRIKKHPEWTEELC